MKIGIIGGGFAGCASAHLISKIKGAQVDLFEASSELEQGIEQIGGQGILTHSVRGIS